MINVIVGEWYYNKDATCNKMKGSIVKSNSGQEFVLTMVQLIGTHASFIKHWFNMQVHFIC